MVLRVKWALLLASALLLLSGCGLRRNPMDTPLVSDSQQPDKELFDRGIDNLEHSRFTVARLILQTLLNTYPDSEYIARAKLGIADSWYRQGGTSNLLQAEAEYKDFITFFPTMPEAAEAQMRVAMIHYREMEKADRDSTHARRAEQEFQKLLLNHPDSQFAALATQRLREVQEVLAQGAFEVARFYFIQGADSATQPRLKELVERYPGFSQADEALYMLGRSLERSGERTADQSVEYYARIARDYPLSERTDEAKKRLVVLNASVPQPDPAAVARMMYEQTHKQEPGITSRIMGGFRRRPSVAAAQGKITPPTMTAQGPAQSDGSTPSLIPRGSAAGRNTLTMENVTESSSSNDQ